MKKFAAGAAGILLLLTAGLFLWIGAQGQDVPIPEAPPPPEPADPESLPEAELDAQTVGPAPPTPPKAYKASREEMRFNRYDRNRDEIITRLEMMSSRTDSFRKLDKDGNNLLTFEEWAVATSDRFAGADANGNGQLTRTEFRTTRPKRSAPRCKC
ncbi:hypothetical protein [Sphingorhabdus sp. M41]|uniref:hypothetical protein n=1 Tax=Sphingorhabdus sp. M41 TaxID=1806885 RepID=UPI00078BD764|nr:hypothetical protein [Sphingorhabdus sp. M41]AMO71573.1 hypothetical protein AZE99_06615 [Sphingorhabdus sp. M41]